MLCRVVKTLHAPCITASRVSGIATGVQTANKTGSGLDDKAIGTK